MGYRQIKCAQVLFYTIDFNGLHTTLLKRGGMTYGIFMIFVTGFDHFPTPRLWKYKIRDIIL